MILSFMKKIFASASVLFLICAVQGFSPAGAEDGLVLRLPLDEGEGTEARDISGKENHGRINNPVWTDDTLRGEGSVLGFGEGWTTRVQVPHDESLSIKDELTLAAWVKLDEYSPEYALHIFRKFDTGDVRSANYLLYLFGNHGGVNTAFEGIVQLYATFDGEITTITPRYKLGTGRWYHVAASYHKEEGGRLYIDGEMVSSPSPGRGELETNDTGLLITHSLGKLSDLRIYNRALSGEEVRSIVREAAGSEHVLYEPLDAKPARAELKGLESGFSVVPGRLAGEKASRLKDSALVWETEADGDYFVEFWMRPSGWDSGAEGECEAASFRAGGEAYRIIKASRGERLMFARGDEVLGLYPVYGWREQEWMGPAAGRLGWRYVNIAVVDGRARLYVDGLAVSGEPAKLRGGLDEFALGGSGAAAFSELRIVRERLGAEEARSRYRHLYRGDDASLIRM